MRLNWTLRTPSIQVGRWVRRGLLVLAVVTGVYVVLSHRLQIQRLLPATTTSITRQNSRAAAATAYQQRKVTGRNQSANSTGLKYILYWNEYYGSHSFNWGMGQSGFLQNQCKVSACYGTSNRSLLAADQFDAVLFHVQTARGWPSARSPHQRYVFVTMEAPSYLSMNLQRLRGVFNWTMTYRRDSDFPMPYSMILPDVGEAAETQRQTAQTNRALGKTKLVAWFVSHCGTMSRRENYVSNLQKHVAVDIYGTCGPLKCHRDDQALPCHQTLLDRDYKFYLSFENALCDGYVTEKFFNALRFNVVPIVYGGSNYSLIAPPHSFIDARQYTPRQLAHLLRALDANDTLYNEYFRWKGSYRIVDKSVFTRAAFCDLCEQLHATPAAVSVYENIHQWWVQDKCARPDS